MGATARERPPRELAIGAVSTALAIGAMAVDHLVGDDPGLEDPLTFGLSAALSVLVAAFVFGRVLPHARTSLDEDAGRAAPRATLVCTVVAVLSLPLLWLGLPFVLGGGALALGLLGGSRRASVAVIVGVLVLALATSAYAFEAGRKLF